MAGVIVSLLMFRMCRIMCLRMMRGAALPCQKF